MEYPLRKNTIKTGAYIKIKIPLKKIQRKQTLIEKSTKQGDKLMSILDLIASSTGANYQKKASTLGGEYKGPCPWCNGKDRFSIHPEKDHYVCRQCRKAGDSIQFVKDYHNKSYVEACQHLNIPVNTKPRPSLDPADQRHRQNIKWSPRIAPVPSATWQHKAAAVLFETYKYLLSPTGKPHREWLNARGINNNTIKTARMGWNTTSLSFDRVAWGLDPEPDPQTGKQKNIWVPAGLIIPYFQNNLPIRLRIRQQNPVGNDPYIIVSGSYMGYFDCLRHTENDTSQNHPAFIVESELDAWLLYQEIHTEARVFAIGNSSARPDTAAHEYISRHDTVLSLDNDPAGQAENTWWIKQYPHATIHPSEFGKDPGEAYEVGVDIAAWAKEGLHQAAGKKTSKAKEDSVTDFYKSGQQERERIIAEYDRKQKRDEEPGRGQEQDQQPAQEKALVDPEIQSGQQFCAHGLFCQSWGNNNKCLINGLNPWLDIERCPKDQWYRYTEGVITMFILSPGVSK